MASKAGTPALGDPVAAQAAEKFKEHDRKKAEATEGAIDMLERRVRNATAEIDLGGGDVIKVRTRLSKAEARQVQECYTGIGAIMAKVQRETVNDEGETVVEKIRDPTPKEEEAVEDYSNRLFSLILHDPARTPDEIYEWLRDNPDAFSRGDQDTIFLTYRWINEAEAEKRENLRKFRPQ